MVQDFPEKFSIALAGKVESHAYAARCDGLLFRVEDWDSGTSV